MMNRIFIFLFVLLSVGLQGQIDSLFNFSYNVKVNDVWGYEDEAGNEYALVGLYDGVSIVDVTDPNNVHEVYRYYSAHESPWRDLKVNGDYLYVSNETGGGINIIDLSPLPQSANLTNSFYTGVNYSFETAHNLYAYDDKLFVVGSNYGGGGIIALDIGDPMNPVEVGLFDQFYVHDIFVQGDRAYSANISEGRFAVLDISDLSNINVLASALTGDKATHNVWVNATNTVLMSTDETNGGSVEVFDISNLNNIEKVDTYKAFYKGDEMPHNVYITDSLAFIAYYKTGLVVLEISDSSNVLEVGRFDTDKSSYGPGSGGAWGAYLNLNSGTILGSDISKGLYGFSCDFNKPGYLEVEVKDASTGFPLNLAEVRLVKNNFKEFTSFSGAVKTGSILFSDDTLIVSKYGYLPDTTIVSFESGVKSNLEVELHRLPVADLTIEIKDNQGNSIPYASITTIYNSKYENEYTVDENGVLFLSSVPVGKYEVYTGAWGYGNNCDDFDLAITGATVDLSLEEGYFDDFSVDKGWETYNFVEESVWDRTQPIASFDTIKGYQHDPESDADEFDCGNFAFCTGIDQYKSAFSTTVNYPDYLISPDIHLNSFATPSISLNYYLGMSPLSNDTIKLGFIQGTDTVLSNYYTSSDPLNKWMHEQVHLPSQIDLNESFRFFVLAEDDLDPWSVIDFAIDNFNIEFPYSAKRKDNNCLSIFNNRIQSGCGPLNFEVYNTMGQLVLKDFTNELIFKKMGNGLYFVRPLGFECIKIVIRK